MVILFPYLAVLDGHNFIGQHPIEVIDQVCAYMAKNPTTNFLPPRIMELEAPIIVTDETVPLEIISLEKA